MPFEHAREVLTHTTEAADDYVSTFRRVARAGELALVGARLGRFARKEELSDTTIVTYEEGAQDHADDRGGEERLDKSCVSQSRTQHEREQRKAELSALGEDDAGPQSLARIVRNRARDEQDDPSLDEHQGDDQRQHEP